MDMRVEAEKIFHNKEMNEQEKIQRLEELALDCQNELDAQAQNMQPGVQHKVSEGLRMAKNFIRELKTK